jgi:hypothetical protein
MKRTIKNIKKMQFPTVNFFFAGNFCGLPGKYLNLPVGLWQKVGKSICSSRVQSCFDCPIEETKNFSSTTFDLCAHFL